MPVATKNAPILSCTENPPTALIQLMLPSANLVLLKFQTFDQQLLLSLAATQPTSTCPNCQTSSANIHSYYDRWVWDSPLADHNVKLHLSVRRFYCRNLRCPKTTFAETLLPQIKSYARRTNRLDASLAELTLALGANAAVRVVRPVLGINLSPDTLLNIIRRTQPALTAGSLKAVGVDDWAFRRGSRYGTILVNLVDHKIIDLLPDDKAATFEAWLSQQPQLEIISRDRATAYAQAANRAAPQALQIADRFHLTSNLLEATQKLVKRHYSQIVRAFASSTPPAAASNLNSNTEQNGDGPSQLPTQTQPAVLAPAPEAPLTTSTSKLAQWQAGLDLRRAEREFQLTQANRKELYERIVGLAEAGVKYGKIAEQLNISAKTVSRYLNGGLSSQRRRGHKTKLTAYKPYLLEQIVEHHYDNARGLWQAITQQGYTGSYSAVSTFVAQVRFELGGLELTGKPLTKRPIPLDATSQAWLATRESSVKLKPPGVVKAAWLLFSTPDRLGEEDLTLLDRLKDSEKELEYGYTLIQEFRQMVLSHNEEGLSLWLESVASNGPAELKSLARGIKRDEKAVRAGLREKWSQGVVEGKVNKLKLIKRKLYGRAKFDLLRLMVLASEKD